jgi:hypothetical protein
MSQLDVEEVGGKGGSNRAAHGDVVKVAYGDVGSSMLHKKDGGGGETWLL